MAVTKIADVVQPELFRQYVIDETAEKAELMYAGAVENNGNLSQLITGGGTILTMPKWNDLSGHSQVLSDSKSIDVNNITSKKELATLLIRGNAWGANELAGALAGDDPMRAISSRVSQWWIRDERDTILSILKGVFASSKMADLKLDITAKSTTKISAEAVLDAKQLMGDASDLLTMIYMHSATFTELQKQNVIQFIPVAESKISIPTYLGYRVVTDDNCPVDATGDTKKYSTFLLSKGCIQRGEGTPATLTTVETDRDSLASNDYLINRRAVVLHPKGISWIGGANITDPTPSNDELATGTNWERISDIKKIGMVELIHTL